MPHKKRRNSKSTSRRTAKVPLVPRQKATRTPATDKQADGSPKPTDTKVAARFNTGDDSASSSLRCYNIPDYRSEHPEFRIFMSGEGSSLEYRVEGDLSAPPPPIRDSKYLSRQQCIAIYRWMLLNRRMEVALENLYKQGKVVGGVYFGLGQEGCSCASAYALGPDDWLGR